MNYKQRLIVLGLAAVVLVSWPCTSQQRKGVEEAATSTVERYSEFKELGDSSFAKGDLTSARKWYSKALKVPLPEAPNYELTVRLAEVHCLLGNLEQGTHLLDEFECMLKIEAGQLRCFEKAEPGMLGPRNKQVSELCFRTMCGEIFLAYYEEPTPDMLARIEKDRQDLKRVLAICQSGRK